MSLIVTFLAESREGLQEIANALLRLEADPADAELMSALFRHVHTLKGNSGLFDLPEMTRVLHAGEDVMDAVRHGRLAFSKELADRLLDAMDFVGMLCDEVGATGTTGVSHADDSVRLATSLRALLGGGVTPDAATPASSPSASALAVVPDELRAALAALPALARRDAAARVQAGEALHFLALSADPGCFFRGDDPFHQARQTPALLCGDVTGRASWPAPTALDVYQCAIDFHLLSAASREELDDHFRFNLEDVRIVEVGAECFPAPVDESGANGATLVDEPPADRDARTQLVQVQRAILALPVTHDWHVGRLRAAGATLAACLTGGHRMVQLPALAQATEAAVRARSGEPLLAWLDDVARVPVVARVAAPFGAADAVPAPAAPGATPTVAASPASIADAEPRFGRRAEDQAGSRALKVDQEKIDRLMDLIGEMVVAKNALPYLADRAEAHYHARELSREIKAQYGVINRIAEEMQDAIMQVRMMPVSHVFQRFPRLVRDIARKLEKDVTLVLEGEETEADKHIIESLGDPLVHILRNSLDHGLERPADRLASGKGATGTLTIRASNLADRVLIEIVDDGRGIDPAVIRAKAYEKGIVDEATLERMSDDDVLNLIFAPGFSTASEISDLSGRGVGMDVVRSAVMRFNGTVSVQSTKGVGTRIALSLPLSMAVTNVMVIESDGQLFGVPMEAVVETVRVPRGDVRAIKQRLTTVLRGRVIPLESINARLGLAAPALANDDDELAVLVVRHGHEAVGLLVDGFRGTMDLIVKPLAGVLSRLPAYAGSALLGDGSVLMVLNVAEIL